MHGPDPLIRRNGGIDTDLSPHAGWGRLSPDPIGSTPIVGIVRRVAQVVIYKSPVQGGLTEENAIAWESLANDLRASGNEVTRGDGYMPPGRRGIIWGEVLLIAVGWKVLDAATNHAIDAAIDRILEVAKRWGRKRFAERGGDVRNRPTSIQIVDEDGRTIASWKIDAEGEQEEFAKRGAGASAEEPQVAPPPWRVEGAEASEAELAALRTVAPEAPPAVWVLLTLHDYEDDVCLVNLDVFVGAERRYRALNLWSFPMRFVVTPDTGTPTVFALEEDDGQPLGIRLTAPGWHCQVHEIDSERYLFLCDPE